MFPTTAHVYDVDYSAEKLRSASGMQPLPEKALAATRLLGRGQFQVLPKTGKALMLKVDGFGYHSWHVEMILDAGAVLTGSFLLHHLMQGAKWVPQSLDLVGTLAALRKARSVMWTPCVDTMAEKRQSWEPLGNLDPGEAKRLGVVDYVEWTTRAGAKLCFFVCAGGCMEDVEEVVSNFDLAICRSFFTGNCIFVPKDTHELLQARQCPLEAPEVVTRTRADRMLARVQKFVARGFTGDLPKTLRIKAGPLDWKNPESATYEVVRLYELLPEERARHYKWAHLRYESFLAGGDIDVAATKWPYYIDVVLHGALQDRMREDNKKRKKTKKKKNKTEITAAGKGEGKGAACKSAS